MLILWLTPHTAQVTGAVRLALSGVSMWVIQGFCTWGSSTVSRYVREAVLGHRSAHLRGSVKLELGLSLQELGKAMLNKRPADRLAPHLTEHALETISVDPPYPTFREDLIGELDQKILALTAPVEVLRERALPIAAKCVRGKLHTVLSSKLAH